MSDSSAITQPRYSCVMADGPMYGRQTLTWAWTLIDLAGVAPDRIVVRTLSPRHSPVRRRLDEMGIETITVQPFAPEFPHCNKLQQLEDSRFAGDAVTLFTDTDIAFVEPVDDLADRSAVAAKVVDLPHPPLDMWRRILDAAGLPAPILTETSFGEHTTPIVNCNGGLYVLPGWAVTSLGEPWTRWVRWLIDRPALLPGGYGVHIDQIGFGLALLERGVTVKPLPLEANCPTHVPELLPDVAPRVIHYHDRLDASGFLLPVGKRRVDDAIARVNDVIRRRQVSAPR